jgi:arabinoxylan arabinofuranohydrolase
LGETKKMFREKVFLSTVFMVAKGKADKQCLMVRGADFSKQVPAKFEARVKGKGKIDVYVNDLKGTPLVSLTCDGKEWAYTLKEYKTENR